MQFAKIIGQTSVKQKLIQTIKGGRISHAQLFLGNEGSGNLALAIAYAQYVNCASPNETDSCGVCSSCVKFEKLIHPDLHFTFPTISPYKLCNELIEDWRNCLIDNYYQSDFDWIAQIAKTPDKQGNITANECRDAIRRLGLKSYEAKFKTLIIWMPEYMEKEGNILLKLLEEPPENTLILLVANDSEAVLPTILSRTQLIKIPQILDEDIERALISNYSIENNRAQSLARLVCGNYNLALKLIDENNEDYFNLFVDWMRKSFEYSKEPKELFSLNEKLTEGGREQIKSFLTYSGQMIRSAFIYKFGHPSLRKNTKEELDFLIKFSQMFNTHNLPLISKSIGDSIYHVERNANVKIILLNLSLYIGKLLRDAYAQSKAAA